MNAISPIAVATGQTGAPWKPPPLVRCLYKHGRVAPFVAWSRNGNGDLVGISRCRRPSV